MDLTERTLNCEVVYKGSIFSIEKHKVALPNGKLSERDLIKHNGAVAIIAITKENKLLLVKQYRKAIEDTIFEIPAGKLDKVGESRLEAAKRELNEETNYEANEWEELVSMSVSPGYLTEKITLFVAKDLYVSKASLLQDEDEFVEVYELDRQAVENLIQIGKICDAKTLYAIQYWDLCQLKGK